MINRVVLMGRLVSDPELKTTGSGLSVTSFRIAVDRSYVKAGEERKADFIDIVCWRNQAEFVCRYFGKGSMIAVEGQLQTRTYQAKDGTNRYVVEVVADNVSFTGERRDNAGGYNNGGNNGGYNNGGYNGGGYGNNGGYGNSGYNNGGFNNQQYGGGNQYGSQQPYQSNTYAQPQAPASYQSGSNDDFQEMPLEDDLPF